MTLVTNTQSDTATQLKSSSAEVFVLAISVLSIVNILLLLLPLPKSAHQVIYIMDTLVCTVLLTDFAVRFHRGRRAYFLGDRGWLDLLGSLPAPGLRFLRL